ncbi:hypothetical protein P7K49_014842 [Saguinus oedipus]|uniref:Uncharacterized protein n=1 Tax=Saguinus oedipus TaxID=9490 RepID=A0ABQ9V7I8_SAGOE|nr:hypothetical protein P7K49_014842 [Saguinus oedipus]
MHPFPCSALLTCFGNTRESASFNQSSVADTHPTVCAQPVAKAGRQPSHPSAEGAPEKRQDSGTHAERNGSANRNSSHHTAVQPAAMPENVPGSLDEEADCEAVAFRTSIPRPSIIDSPKVSECSLRAYGRNGAGGALGSFGECFSKQTRLTFLLNKALQGTLTSERKCVKAIDSQSVLKRCG